MEDRSKAKLIKPEHNTVIVQMSKHEYGMMKLALKYYENGYTLKLLRRLEKQE